MGRQAKKKNSGSALKTLPGLRVMSRYNVVTVQGLRSAPNSPWDWEGGSEFSGQLSTMRDNNSNLF